MMMMDERRSGRSDVLGGVTVMADADDDDGTRGRGQQKDDDTGGRTRCAVLACSDCSL